MRWNLISALQSTESDVLRLVLAATTRMTREITKVEAGRRQSALLIAKPVLQIHTHTWANQLTLHAAAYESLLLVRIRISLFVTYLAAAQCSLPAGISLGPFLSRCRGRLARVPGRLPAGRRCKALPSSWKAGSPGRGRETDWS